MDILARSRPAAANRVLAACLARVAEDDRAAFEQLYRLVGPRLFAVIRRRIAQPQPAEDVLQETFLTIWRKATLFDPARGDAMAWMTTIARHCAIDWLRRPGGEALLPAAPTERSAAAALDESLAMGQCLGSLPAPQRQVLTLAYYHGMSHGEISRALGIPVGTVKSRIRRGLLAVRDMIER